MITYTTEDLLLFIYGETTDEQTELIMNALTEDWELKEQYDILKNSMEALDQMVVSPRSEFINAILRYAGVTTELEHR